jgi:hypothetical protein
MAARQGDCRVAAEAADQFGVLSGHHHPSSIGKYLRQNPDKTSQVQHYHLSRGRRKGKKRVWGSTGPVIYRLCDLPALALMSLLVLAFKD